MRDEKLEREIDRMGRDAVFARVRSYGWSGSPPPKWVWWNVIAEMRAELRADLAEMDSQGTA